MTTSQTIPTGQTAVARRPLQPIARYGKSFAIGAAFAVGWTPCIGPILGAVLTMAASSGTVLRGTVLLASWSLGLGVPFLIAGLALGQVMTGMRKIRPLMPALEIAGGLLVIVIGSLIFLDRFTIFNQYFTGGTSTVTNAEGGLTGIDVNSAWGFVVAFAAGVIAFLSPCCLPMVPAYLMHLAGVSTENASKGHTFRHALAFVLGFSVLFVALGASAGALGYFMHDRYFVRDNLDVIGKVAGTMLIIMGLNLIGIMRIPWLYRTYQIDFPSSPAETS